MPNFVLNWVKHQQKLMKCWKLSGDEALNCSSVFEMFKRFKSGCEDIQDGSRSGSPSTSRNADTVTFVFEMVTWDNQWTLRMMVDEWGDELSNSSWRLMEEEDLHKVHPTQTYGWAEAMETHHAKTSFRRIKTIPVVLIAFFSFLTWKLYNVHVQMFLCFWAHVLTGWRPFHSNLILWLHASIFEGSKCL
jgi:hypothetical protein